MEAVVHPEGIVDVPVARKLQYRSDGFGFFKYLIVEFQGKGFHDTGFLQKYILSGYIITKKPIKNGNQPAINLHPSETQLRL